MSFFNAAQLAEFAKHEVRLGFLGEFRLASETVRVWNGNTALKQAAIVTSRSTVNRLARSSIKGHFNNGSIEFDYVLDATALDVPTEKTEFLTAGDVFDAKYTAIDVSSIETSYWIAGAGDTFVTETPSTKTADAIGWSVSGSTGRWHIAWCPVKAAMTYQLRFQEPTFFRGFIRTTAGFESTRECSFRKQL